MVNILRRTRAWRLLTFRATTCPFRGVWVTRFDRTAPEGSLNPAVSAGIAVSHMKNVGMAGTYAAFEFAGAQTISAVLLVGALIGCSNG